MTDFRARLAADIAAGRTVSLSPEAMVDPVLRQLLGDLVGDLGDADRTTPPELPHVPGYTLFGQIGKGGQSEVYLARDDELRRPVAIKVMRGFGGDQGVARTRMLREARALARIHHPNIVTVYTVVETAGMVVIVMEWVDGLTLAKLLRELPPKQQPGDLETMRQSLGTLPNDTACFEATALRTFVRILRDVARGAEQAHAAGLLHLDIKPGNVLVRRNGQPLLIDFGLAREIDLELTHTQSFAGTPIYASPEQLRRDDDQITAKTDVYGLGITLYELIARRQPLQTHSFSSALRAVETGRLPRLSSLAAVPRDLENIVHKAIAVEPGLRYPTAAALADDLDAFLQDGSVDARAATPLQRLRRYVRAEPWRATFVMLLALTLPIFGVLARQLWRRDSATEVLANQQFIRSAQARAQTVLQAYLITYWTPPEGQPSWSGFGHYFGKDTSYTAVALLLEADEHPESARKLIDSLPDAWRGLPAVRSLGHRLREHRPFFTHAEAAALVDSREELELLIVAIDRVLEFLDSDADDDLREIAMPAVDRAISLPAFKNPVSQALRAVIAGHLHRQAECETACLALSSTFGDDECSCLWRMLAKSSLAARAAVDAGLEFLRRHPDNWLIASMTASWMHQAGQHADAVALLRKSSPPPDREPGWHFGLASSLQQAGLADEARAELGMGLVAPGNRDPWAFLTTLFRVDPQMAIQESRKAIATDPSLSNLLTILAATGDLPDTDLAIRWEACRVGLQRFPHRARFRLILARHRLNEKQWPAAADLYEGCRIPRTEFHWNAMAMAMAFLKTGRWTALGNICQAWAECVPTEPNMLTYFHYYYGTWKSRIGHVAEAREHLLAAQASEHAVSEQQQVKIGFELLWLEASSDRPDVDTERGLLTHYPRAYSTYAFDLCALAKAHLDVGNRDRGLQTLVDARKAANAALARGEPISPGAPDGLAEWLTALEAKYK